MRPRVFELSKSPPSFLLVDRDPEEGWLVAFWRIRDPVKDRDVPLAPAQPFDAAVELGVIPAGAKREAWARRAGRAPVGGLEWLLDELLRGAHDPGTTALYVENRWQG